ncbi:MAG: GTPase Era [candidate division WOR-3 bacterium]
MELKKIKVGIVGIIGRPNVGKSTLLNQILKAKISIVTPKPQTTRVPILGVLQGEDYQIAFMDTPGMLEKTKYELHKQMVRSIEIIIKDSDLVLFMVPPFDPEEIEEIIIEKLRKFSKNSILLINKVDLVKKENILPIIDIYSKKYNFLEIIPISASEGDGLDRIVPAIIKNLPYGEPLYPDDILSDKTERFFVAEIIREKIFLFYGEELPYASCVEIEEFNEKENIIYIRAIIYVEKESQRRMIIGQKGSKIKKLGIAARKDIEGFLGKKVYLDLWVKVKEGWREDKGFLREIGYIS